MKRNFFRWGLGSLVVGLLVLWMCTYQVREGWVAVVTRFGDPVRITAEAGLHAKWPWPGERVRLLDNRRRIYETRFRETLTRDKKNIILLTYLVWAIDDPLRFVQAVGTLEAAELKLDGMVSNAKNAVMGKYELAALVSIDPERLRVDEIERTILQEVRERARSKLGVDVLQVGIKRLALPEENVRYVFQQMRTERSRFSAEAKAEGKKESQAIIDETDVRRAEILARATEEAARIRGAAEAEAARLYAEAQREDPEFYEWLRSLDSLRRLLDENATVILRTDAAPFHVLGEEGDARRDRREP